MEQQEQEKQNHKAEQDKPEEKENNKEKQNSKEKENSQEQENNIENIFSENNHKWQEIKQSELSLEQKQQEEIKKINEQFLRAKAEIENIKRRTDKEKKEIVKYAFTNFARELLTVADNITRALQSIDEDEKNNSSEAVKNLIIGIEMTEKELYKIFNSHQIKKIHAIGKKFDPNFHQAFFKLKTDEFPEGYVAQVINEGFTIEERVLRPSMVAVAEQQTSKKNNDNEKLQFRDKNQEGADFLKTSQKKSKPVYDKKLAEDSKKDTTGVKIDKNA